MAGIPATAPNADSDLNPEADAVSNDPKRAVMTNERLMVLANTLMDPALMEEYGLILDSTPKLGFKNGTQPFFEKLTRFFNELEASKRHKCMVGVTLGWCALKSWVSTIKVLARTEQDRLDLERSTGRAQPPPAVHISACHALMTQFLTYNAAKQKNPTNRYNAKPQGLEHLELHKTDDPSISDIAGGSGARDVQDAAAGAVRELKKARTSKRQLHEEGMAATGGREPFKPQLKISSSESSEDRVNDSMAKYFEADSVKAVQEALKLMDERKTKKMENIKVLQGMLAISDDAETKALLNAQIRDEIKAMARLSEEERVRTEVVEAYLNIISHPLFILHRRSQIHRRFRARFLLRHLRLLLLPKLYPQQRAPLQRAPRQPVPQQRSRRWYFLHRSLPPPRPVALVLFNSCHGSSGAI